jgi:hypothetical protein
MPTADADGYGTASDLLAAERGLDLSLTAGTALVVPRFPAGGKAPGRFVLRGSGLHRLCGVELESKGSDS